MFMRAIFPFAPHKKRERMAPKIRQAAPAFTAEALVDGEFKQVSLADYKGKYVVLFFYPLDFTFVCPTEIIAFSDRVDEFKKLDTEVLACSIDSVHTHLAWTNTPRKRGGLGPMKIPIIGDINKEVGKAYDVLIEDGDAIGAAFRALFIIDGQGILRQSTINDLPVGRNVDEVLRLLEAFKHTDEHGVVCPANWKKGGVDMTADPIKSKAYFEKVNADDAATNKRQKTA